MMVVMMAVVVMMVMVVVMVMMLLLLLLLSLFGVTRLVGTASAGVGLVLCAKEIIQDVNDGGDVPLWLTIGVLEGGVQSTCKSDIIESP